MIIPDANLLLYAYDEASPLHLRAKSWWSTCLSGPEPVRLVAVVLFAFTRIGTSPKVEPRFSERARRSGGSTFGTVRRGRTRPLSGSGTSRQAR